jgi:hypothetical protein
MNTLASEICSPLYAMKIPKLLFFFCFLLSKGGFSQAASDTVFKINKHFKIRLQVNESSTTSNNAKLTILRDGKFLRADSLFCFTIDIKLGDMNQDGFKDLLIFESTGGRGGNGYYNLFLFCKQKNDFVKVNNFHDWPNVETTKAKGILVSTGLSANTYFHFLKLTDSGRLIDLNIEQEDKDGEGKSYEIGFLKAKRRAKPTN